MEAGALHMLRNTLPRNLTPSRSTRIPLRGLWGWQGWKKRKIKIRQLLQTQITPLDFEAHQQPLKIWTMWSDTSLFMTGNENNVVPKQLF